MLPGLEPLPVPSEEDALALATGFRFYDECLCFPIVELLFENLEVLWENKCPWEEAEVFREVLLHRYQVLS